MSTLVLGSDYQPVNFLPLSTIGWETAVKLHFLDKVSVIEWYEDWIIHSARMEMQVPAVVVIKKNFKRRRLGPMKFSKYNLYLRDLYTCQYCNTPYTKHNLTLDHVIPLSLGGRTSWTNIVAACGPCNTRKGNKTHMKPIKTPYAPNYYELVDKRKQLDMQIAHPSWNAYI